MTFKLVLKDPRGPRNWVTVKYGLLTDISKQAILHHMHGGVNRIYDCFQNTDFLTVFEDFLVQGQTVDRNVDGSTNTCS